VIFSGGDGRIPNLDNVVCFCKPIRLISMASICNRNMCSLQLFVGLFHTQSRLLCHEDDAIYWPGRGLLPLDCTRRKPVHLRKHSAFIWVSWSKTLLDSWNLSPSTLAVMGRPQTDYSAMSQYIYWPCAVSSTDLDQSHNPSGAICMKRPELLER
jgi:hypothetical protein